MDRGELLRERNDVLGIDTRDLGRGRDGTSTRPRCDELVDAGRVRVDEGAVDEALAIEMAHHAEHERHVGAGPQREVTIGPSRHRGATGIDDDQAAPCRAGLAARAAGSGCSRSQGSRPTPRQLAVHHVERIGRQHRAERRLRRGAVRGGTDRVRHAARTSSSEQAPRETAPTQRPGRRVVEVRHDRPDRAPPRRSPRRSAATRSSASSHDATRNSPAPFGPTRTSGVSTRSGAYTRRACCLTLAQMKPWVIGFAGPASIATIRPSSTETSSEQVSGQSSGHAVESRTVTSRTLWCAHAHRDLCWRRRRRHGGRLRRRRTHRSGARLPRLLDPAGLRPRRARLSSRSSGERCPTSGSAHRSCPPTPDTR